MIDDTLTWFQRRVRYWRWPHRKWSAGFHRWRSTDTRSQGARRWECVRCGAGVMVWPLDQPPLLWNRGERLADD